MSTTKTEKSGYDVAEELGFFAYHGDGKGDHYRKSGLSGWKLILHYKGYDILQKTPSGLKDWTLVRSYDYEETDAFRDAVTTLVKNGHLEDNGDRREWHS